MDIGDEELEGTRVTLYKGDNFADVPRSHLRLISAGIERWWADPAAAFRDIARRAESKKMREWFRLMAEQGGWRLELHESEHAERAGYLFFRDGVRGAEVGPPSSEEPADRPLPEALRNYYQLVGYVDWMEFGAAGGLVAADEHTPLTTFGVDFHGDAVEPSETFVFGWGPAGDMIIYTADGRGGWVGHEEGRVRLIGTTLETIDWVYGELLADRCPDFNP